MAQQYTEYDAPKMVLENLDALQKAIVKIQEETLDLELLNSQSKIIIQQNKDDIEMLKEIKKNLAFLVTKQNTTVTQAEATLPVETKPKPQPHISQPHEGNPLSQVTMDWSVAPEEFKKNNNVSLRYCLSSNTVICAVNYSSDGRLFAFADAKTLFIMNSSDGSLVGTGSIPIVDGKNEQYVRVLVFSPDSKYIALAGKNNDIYVFSVANPQSEMRALKNHTNTVSSLAFSPDSKKLYSGSYDGMICMWDTSTFTVIKTKSQLCQNKDEYMVTFALSHDGSFIAVGFMKGNVALYSAQLDDKAPMIIKPHDSILLGLELSFDDDYLATTAQDQTSTMWKLQTFPKMVHKFEGHSELVLTVCFSRDGSLLFTGSKDETIKCWSAKTGNCIFTLRAHNNTVFQVHHHPSEDCFVTCSGDCRVCVWDYKAIQ
ncbi:Transcriptional repressor tup12-related protein [Trichomonas vaginalis G3]|uniref:Transcriptional repressor tup12-related protein n=1 Tax=Trichomonas vaginalis (strain ATCC PRA-98 / G3) TaxID=412133 RepID=A2FR92_TRIV3|nr:WD repeat-containing protein family [Trichomonas vaginalis G3]EAX92568.1 Transcriptional repressor tup12-related protein [Trichomonas vaginalis G3]KAI5504420.1 WD repeat-containing protein family [Trichomonas vaginalis G3]|eukprot:XP_001305498.1 Transcriptional repressor tup12-related protein [Trichomonas vaginalis G3]